MTLTDIVNIVLEEIGVKAIGSIDGDDVRYLRNKIDAIYDKVSDGKR